MSTAWSPPRGRRELARGIPFQPPVSPLDGGLGSVGALESSLDVAERRRVFDIRVADCDEQRGEAGILIDRMYATRGYLSDGLSRRANDRKITLVASEADAIVGTLTLGFDNSTGLLVDQLFRAETDRMRDAGLALCEFTKLAIDGAMRSRRLIASLFHAAYIFAHPLMASDRLLIEVNPRHVGYYQRMLGFVVIGAPRLNSRVEAPAVLMALDLAHARAQIDAVGGTGLAGGQADTRSLYPFFFPLVEERDILRRAERNIPSHEPLRVARHTGRERRAGPPRGAAVDRPAFDA